MKTLVVEDDFTSRKLLQRFLSQYGECDVAVSGTEAVEAFQNALEERRYDLVCLDIKLPNKDGQKVLTEIREMEKAKGILGLEGAKIIMTTACGDSKNVIPAFRAQCDAYLVKPFDCPKLLGDLKSLGLVK